MEYSLINKYLSGEASEDEVREIIEWIEAKPENRSEFIQYKKAWVLTAESNEDQDRVWNEVILKRVKLGSRIRILRFMRNAAAIVILLSLGAIAYYLVNPQRQSQQIYTAETQIQVPLGQMSNLVLPDGTTVQLNSDSHFFYSGHFVDGKRIVRLEGEAFFHVAKDHKHPFIVQTQDLDFKVYGTSFNVQAYPEDKEVNTTLVEGSLGVMNKNGKEYTRLVPGENVNYQKDSKRLDVQKVKLDLYTSWQKGLITFRNESLKEIAKKLERWYNVKIVFKNPELENELYYGTIMKNKPIDQILEVFRLTSGIKYQIVTRPDKPTLIYWE